MDANRRLIDLTAGIVTAYAGNASIPIAELPALIREVHRTLRAAALAEDAGAEPPPVPAVPIGNSITRDHLICLEDGRKFRTLKRYLRNVYGLSPAEYRLKWGLPDDYPMVAPSYAAARSELAKQTGLGRGPRGAGPAPAKRQKAK